MEMVPPPDSAPLGAQRESPMAEGQAGQRRLCGEAGKWAGQVASVGHVGRVEGCTLAGARHVGSPRSPAGEENLLACGKMDEHSGT